MRIRDRMYFEPRVVTETGHLNWYNERYSSDRLMHHAESTVYVRDNGKRLYIYALTTDDGTIAMLKIIDELDKRTENTCYGYKFHRIDTENEQELLKQIKQLKTDLQSTSSLKRQRDLNKYLRKLHKELKRVRRNVS